MLGWQWGELGGQWLDRMTRLPQTRLWRYALSRVVQRGAEVEWRAGQPVPEVSCFPNQKASQPAACQSQASSRQPPQQSQRNPLPSPFTPLLLINSPALPYITWRGCRPIGKLSWGFRPMKARGHTFAHFADSHLTFVGDTHEIELKQNLFRVYCVKNYILDAFFTAQHV